MRKYSLCRFLAAVPHHNAVCLSSLIINLLSSIPVRYSHPGATHMLNCMLDCSSLRMIHNL
ncbi:hypothetical protein M404DRAFT_812458 [Pisolithus tinctorius Marx 270]|uniref:Uncharacterized protein n=1 Tax=Pisolithus tinctorius Marx 270 TaxID=870435 RepID=A0A0C3JPH9_PISTI|nr:hypothetical protein M404DRAFT_812458 [Pisolithus tinctorius Marx 270]